MPDCQTKYFGTLTYTEETVISMPRGMFGFEEENEFVVIQRPDQFPLSYLQSLLTPELCFLALPVLVACSNYRLAISEQDLALLEFAPAYEPQIGKDVLCLSIITTQHGGPTANLMAPVVINLQTRTAAQCIDPEGIYSHQQPLLVEPAQ
jgi:flagellar assembly factor FliW